MDEERGSEEKQDDTKPCPVCGETIKAAAIKCRFCGEDLQAFQLKKEAAVEREIFSGRPAVVYSVWQLLLVIVTLGIAWIVMWFKRAGVNYRLTSQRIQVERGIFSKTKQTTELFRIDDFVISRPFSMRIMGYGYLVIKSSDRSIPDLTLYGVKEIETIYEQLRKASFAERERRGIKVWANA